MRRAARDPVSILCGLAIGYADPDFPPIEKNVVFVDNVPIEEKAD